MTVAYGLWAVALADTKPDDTTAALTAYLLKTQAKDGSWAGQVARPPLEESALMCTVLAVRALKRYATLEQRPTADAAIAKAKTWIATAPQSGQEDRAARLWGIYTLAGSHAEFLEPRSAVLKAHRADGGLAHTGH